MPVKQIQSGGGPTESQLDQTATTGGGGGSSGVGTGHTGDVALNARQVLSLVRNNFLKLLNDWGLPYFFSGGFVEGQSVFLWLDVPDLTPTGLTANVNDYDPGLNQASSFRISAAGPVNITGIAAGTDGRVIVLLNTGAFAITLVNQSVLSAAENRIITGTGANLVIPADGHAVLKYDAATARWRVISDDMAAIAATTTLGATLDAALDDEIEDAAATRRILRKTLFQLVTRYDFELRDDEIASEFEIAAQENT